VKFCPYHKTTKIIAWELATRAYNLCCLVQSRMVLFMLFKITGLPNIGSQTAPSRFWSYMKNSMRWKIIIKHLATSSQKNYGVYMNFYSQIRPLLGFIHHDTGLGPLATSCTASLVCICHIYLPMEVVVYRSLCLLFRQDIVIICWGVAPSANDVCLTLLTVYSMTGHRSAHALE
jgi:hypothetical protein